MIREFASQVYETRLPPTELADYDFLRATYEALLRSAHADAHAIDAAFDALDAAHERLKTAHGLRRAVRDKFDVAVSLEAVH